ncbi:MAG: prephenate dehydrogenase/arogenate dehydrogenase family protein [Bacteroidaceae bacterium]|nr:prephenate dehydrogenase/arogenate dehydrogenase family protein [Bacteroidaceae bacterium]
MKIGIAGLGLIGGSAVKAYKAAGHIVYGYDTDSTILGYAKLNGAIDDILTPQRYAECSLLILAATPKAMVAYLEENAAKIPDSVTVVDFCGIKGEICSKGFSLAAKYGFTYIGGHPMAGSQYSGFKHSRATLFKGASMIIVPPVYDNMGLLDSVKQLLAPLGFKSFVVTTAGNHDAMIAYTSQMCHIVSNAFVKSPTALKHHGYSAGSFRDLTRVARLNEAMWTELFMNNKEPLVEELDRLIGSLQQYRDALMGDDAEQLCTLLREGRIAKEQSEG